MKYLIIGAGGTGGLIAAYMAKSSHNVTILARGKHLEAIQNSGLKVNSHDGNSHVIHNIRALSADALGDESFDVIFVCVKAYNLEDAGAIIKRIENPKTLVIPVLNAMNAGRVLRKCLTEATVFDGCIYITGYISAPGEIKQNNAIFRVVYGDKNISITDYPVLNTVNADLEQSNIYVKYTQAIESEIFQKLCFTSAFSAVGLFYNVAAKEMRENNSCLLEFENLLHEQQRVADAYNYTLDESFIENNLKILRQLADNFTTSLQKDVANGGADERENMIFEIVKMANTKSVDIPCYEKIAKFLGYVVK